jgi:hypothetical protein
VERVAEDALDATRGLRTVVRVLLTLLVAQYLLGEWVNLFGSFPAGPPSLGSALVDLSDPPLAAHLLIAIALLFGSLLALAFAWASEHRGLALASGLGFVGVLGAGVAGALFVYSGYSNNADSYAMAGLFLLAFSGFASAHFLAERRLRELALGAPGRPAAPNG